MYVYTSGEKAHRAELFRRLREEVQSYTPDDLARLVEDTDEEFESLEARWHADPVDERLRELRHIDYLIRWRAAQLLQEMEEADVTIVHDLVSEESGPHWDVHRAIARALALSMAEREILADVLG